MNVYCLMMTQEYPDVFTETTTHVHKIYSTEKVAEKARAICEKETSEDLSIMFHVVIQKLLEEV